MPNSVRLACLRCRGRRVIESSCSMCHDSTWDHECDDTSEPCPECAGAPAASLSVLAEVLAERARQEAKWGEQNHPDVDVVLIEREGGCTVERMAEECGVSTARRARANLDGEARMGRATWSLIAVEELAEAIEAATLAAQHRVALSSLREELVQLAAVAVAWVEAIDRRPQPASEAAPPRTSLPLTSGVSAASRTGGENR